MSKPCLPFQAVVAMIVLSGGLWTCAETLGDPLTLQIKPSAGSADRIDSVFVSGRTATNFILQTSIDLKAWEEVYQSFGWPGANPIYAINAVVEGQSSRFWRAVPGDSLDRLKQRWQENEPTEYTFRLRNEPCLCPGSISGTVRVRKGSIVEVTDAVDDFTGQPIPQPDVSRFLTIAQLFDAIRREFESRSEQVQVTYDSSGLFPTRIFIDRIIGAADDESLIEAVAFAVVEP